MSLFNATPSVWVKERSCIFPSWLISELVLLRQLFPTEHSCESSHGECFRAPFIWTDSLFLTEKNEGLWNHRIRNGCQISTDKQIPPTLTARKTNTRNGDRWESVGRGGVLDHTKQQNGLCSLEAIRPRGPQLLPAAHVCLLCSQMSLPPLPLLLQCDGPNSKWERMAAWRVCLNEIWFALHGSHSLAHSNTAWLC